MRSRTIARLLAVVATTSLVIFGCAQIAGLDDPSTSSGGGSSGSSGGGDGSAAAGDFDIQPKQLDFPPTDCGQQATKTLAIFNQTKFAADYKVRSVDGVFVVKNPAGSIPAGAVANVEVVATPTGPVRHETSLQVELNGATRAYPVNVLGQGAAIELSQLEVDFGDVRKENGGEAKVIVKNAGSKSLDAVFEASPTSPDFSVTPTTVHANPDGTAEITVKMTPGGVMASPASATFKPRATGVCGTIPQLVLRGKRITTDVTIDVVDWGDVACKSNPADRDAIIKNYGPSTINYTSTISGTAFSITGNGSASVGGGTGAAPATQKIKLHVSPGTTPEQKDETLTINYGGPQPSTGKVRAYVFGLVLAITPGASAFSSDGGTEQRKTFDIKNTGKFGGYVSLNAGYQVTGSGFRVENGTQSYLPAFLVFPPSTGAVDVVFKGAAPANGNLTVTGPVCSQNTVSVTGTNP